VNEYELVGISPIERASTAEDEADKISSVPGETKLCQKISQEREKHGDIDMIHIDKSKEIGVKHVE
jgi:hypothetical protein